MRNLIFLFIFMLLLGCKKNLPISSLYFDDGVEISVKDKAGNDLLNPTNPNSYLENNIKIFYLINGKKEEVYFPNYDYPRKFRILETNGEYRMELNLNANEQFATTYVQWNDNDTDTLKSEIYSLDNFHECKKLWHNSTLVWTWDNYNKRRSMEIMK